MCQSEINFCYKPKHPMNSIMPRSIFWQNNNFGHYWATTFHIPSSLPRASKNAESHVKLLFFSLAFDVSCPPKKTNESKFLFFYVTHFSLSFLLQHTTSVGERSFSYMVKQMRKEGIQSTEFRNNLTVAFLPKSHRGIEHGIPTVFYPHLCIADIVSV